MPSPLLHRRLRNLVLISIGFVLIAFVLVCANRWRANAAAVGQNVASFTSDGGSIKPAASTITVNSTADVANDSDGLCTLREAITAANNNTASGAVAGECAAGSGGIDTIDLTGITGAIDLTQQLPQVTFSVTLNGPGANLLTIQRSSAGGTPNFTIFVLALVNSETYTFSRLTISNGNNPGGSGGAIRSIDPTATVSSTVNVVDCMLTGNAASHGGGIFNTQVGTLNVVNTSIINNTALADDPALTQGGGGIFSSGFGAVNIINSNISNNTTAGTGNGGGIVNFSGGTATLTNSTISGNSTINGGGIYNTGVMDVNNCTIVRNTASVRGGGVFNGNQFRSRNSIIALNTAPTDTDVTGLVSQGHNLIGVSNGGITPAAGDLIGSTGTPIDPLLGPLQNNGGFTATTALLPGSPALDAGDDCVTQAAHCGDPKVSQLTTDQRGTGFSRQVDGPDANATATVDIGAYETQRSLADLPATSTNEDAQVVVTFDGGDTSTITSVTATSTDSTLVPNDVNHINAVMTGSTGILTINPATNLSGTTNITITINRSVGGPDVGTFLLTVNPVPDAPSVSGATTTVNTQTTSGLVVSRNVVDGLEVTHFKITNIQNGTLFKNAGPQINSGDFITFAEGNAGLKFTPGNNLSSPGSNFTFDVQSSLNNTNAGLGGGVATATITVNCGPTVVSNNNDSGPGSLRAVIATACSGATITFDLTPGQVTSPITLTSGELSISKNLTIQGPGANLLTISGNNNSRIFNIQSGQTASLTDLTIANGQNASIPGGGGVLNNGTLTLTNCNFYGNVSASLPGGAVHNNGTSLTLTNCNLGGTSAGQPNSGSSGAAVYNNIGTLNMTGGSIVGNSGGPAAVTNSGTVTFTDVSMTNNTGNTSGAMLTNDGTTTLIGCLVANNTGGSQGGGIGAFGLGSIMINNTTISGNVSATHGGGLFVNANSQATLVNVTITNNRTTSGNGGGIATFTPNNCVLQNTIVAGNFIGASPGTTGDEVNGMLSGSSSFNLVGQAGTGGLTNGVNNNQVVANARLGALANNGGVTLTHALLSGSPALDAGSNTLANNAGLTNDQRGSGFPRLVDGPDADATNTVDVGAFEAQVFVEDIADKATNEDTQLQFTFNVGGGVSIASVTATASNTTLVPNSPSNIDVTGSGTSRTLTINPALDQSGTSTITVTVNGSSGGSMADTFVLSVNPIADTPSVTNATTNEDTQSSSGLVISRNASDGAEVTHFKITNITNGALFKNNGVTAINNGDFITFAEGNAGLRFTPAANLNSSSTTFSFQVQGATSAGGAGLSSGLATAAITVNAVNDTPSFTKGPNQTVNEDAAAQTANNWAISISAGPADEAGQTVSFNITGNTNAALFSAGPAVSANGTLTYTPAPDANGTATITLVIQDNGGTANGGVDTSASQTFTITVNSVNDAPSFTKGADQTVNNNAGAQTVPNWATNLSAGPANETGQTLTFQITNNTNTALFSSAPAVSSTGTLTYTPASNAGGTATITLRVQDSGGTANGGVNASPTQSFNITINAVGGTINFSAATNNTTESSGFTTVTVNRTGDLTRAVTVDYASSANNGLPCSTANGVATPKCDFTTALGTLNFGAGENTKTVTILISQDSFVEGPETFTLTLSNPTNNAALGTTSTATTTIGDDVTEPSTNAIDDVRNFVRQHYHDFLNREPDQSGWDFWTNQITSCGSDMQCNEVRRIDVSASFFLSIEFQQTGYLVERFYKVAYGDATGNSTFINPHTLGVPIVRANEFLTDTQRIGRGVIVLAPGWEQLLESNKQAYALEFVQTTRFTTTLPTSLTPGQFVDRLNQNSGGPLSLSERQAAIDLFGGAGNSSNVTARAQCVRMVADDQTLYDAEFNRAFVLTEYIGYLRRNPNDAPDTDYTGYDFWLTKLNQFNGNYINAEMVKAFLSSIEYRQRFGP